MLVNGAVPQPAFTVFVYGLQTVIVPLLLKWIRVGPVYWQPGVPYAVDATVCAWSEPLLGGMGRTPT